MTMTAFTLDDLGGALSQRALLHFVRGLPDGSRTVAAMHPDLRERSDWAGSERVQMLLADVVDSLAGIQYTLMTAFSKNPRSVPRPEPVPRPGVRGGERRTIGAGPIPVSEFDSWWDDRRPAGS